MKVCPICKSRCFDDMDTCYGCLHNFAKEYDDDVFSYPETPNTSEIPEYFELDSFPQIEDPVIPKHSRSNFSDFAELPEYFELDCFPQIEDVSTQHVPQHSHNNRSESLHYLSDITNQEDKIKLTIEIPKSLINFLP